VRAISAILVVAIERERGDRGFTSGRSWCVCKRAAKRETGEGCGEGRAKQGRQTGSLRRMDRNDERFRAKKVPFIFWLFSLCRLASASRLYVASISGTHAVARCCFYF
jgi:hypothetical protein